MSTKKKDNPRKVDFEMDKPQKGTQKSTSNRKGKYRKRNYTRFHSAIYKLLPTGTGIGSKAMAVLDSMTKQLIRDIAIEAVQGMGTKKTIQTNSIVAAAKRVIPFDLFKWADKEAGGTAIKSSTNYFKHSRVGRLLRKHTNLRVSKNAVFYLTGISEAIIFDVLDTAVKIAKTFKKRRVTQKHIALAINQDESFLELFKGTIPSSGHARRYNQEEVYRTVASFGKKSGTRSSKN
jgi:histone H3/H4